MKKSNSDEKLVEQYTSRDRGLIARYLGVKKYKMRTMTNGFSPYKKALFCKAVTETIKEYDERASFGLYYGEVITANYEFLEVGRGINEELMTCGYRLVIKDKARLAVSVSESWTGTLILNLSYSDSDAKAAVLFINSVIKYMKENNFYIGEKIDVNGKFLAIEDIDFDSVVLPANQKKSIKIGALDFFKKKEIYAKAGLSFKRGMLLTGQPGTGKTLLGKILMKQTESTFIWVTAAMMQEASDVDYLFRMASELGNCILFLEDIDDYLEKSGAVDVLKTAMDGLGGLNDGIVTILCTNFPDRIPKALCRPGRLDEIFILQLPDEALRYKILMQVSKEMDLENREEELQKLAKETEGLTPACLKEIIIYSLLLAVDDERETINKEDLSTATFKVKDTKETVTDRLSEIDEKKLVIEIKKSKESD